MNKTAFKCPIGLKVCYRSCFFWDERAICLYPVARRELEKAQDLTKSDMGAVNASKN